MTLVSNDILEPGDYSGAMPMMPTREWRKNAVHIRRLDARLKGKKAE
jgi:UDP-3-O-[3-hydroxymyristoyl] glucosamine N-acyltransferase